MFFTTQRPPLISLRDSRAGAFVVCCILLPNESVHSQVSPGRPPCFSVKKWAKLYPLLQAVCI